MFFSKNSFVLCFDAGGGQNLDLNLGLSCPSDGPRGNDIVGERSVVKSQFKCFNLIAFHRLPFRSSFPWIFHHSFEKHCGLSTRFYVGSCMLFSSVLMLTDPLVVVFCSLRAQLIHLLVDNHTAIV